MTKLKTISKVEPKWKKSTKIRTKWLFKPYLNYVLREGLGLAS